MPVRPPASPDDIKMLPVLAALKKYALRLVLISVVVGGATYAILSAIAPMFQSDVLVLQKLPLSVLVMVASMALGTAWTIAHALLQGTRNQSAAIGPHSKSAGLPKTRDERAPHPALPSAPSRPSTASASVQGAAGEGDPSNSLLPEAVRTTAVETTTTSLATRIKAQKPAQGGHRTLISGDSDAVNPTSEVLALVKTLSDDGGQVMLVDWCPSGKGMAAEVKIAPGIGLTELLVGDAGFEDVVRRLPGSRAHIIGCGAALDSVDIDVEPDQLNLVLDALDEAYDYIVVAGTYEDARFLFEAIQGRFDTGIIVGNGKTGVTGSDEPAGTFLGFEVTDIDVVRFERPTPVVPISQQRILRAMQKPVAEPRVV